MAQTMEQRRAAYAWEVVNQLEPGLREKYGKLAKGLPAMVMNSGLMQVLAFLNDKNEPHHRALLSHICYWMGTRFGGEQLADGGGRFPRANEATFANAMKALFEAGPEQFRRLTAEMMAVLRWIRQLASAL